ncbi:Loganate O-methyltransferase [Handroanthus impetiginosus]|uniref:Loganate O-methyltransferase n=1 Tax=Handroanthus impetiginosus TaxID=429701 RepID=A0A2G9GSM5_9LAMI|nr:Loganate O-methyltransferase [Handroanthus impetiginosus]
MEEKKFNGTSSKHHMVAGDGPDRYAHNSHYQKEVLISAEDIIHQLVDKHLNTQNPFFTPHNTFIIAIGPNTFLAVENIISSIENKNKKLNQNQTLDFQVYFSDLIENDFNTLFKSLPSTRIYLVAGSFYSRLLPKKTIHFAHCSTSLHWLSSIPKEVIESGNKGKVHYLGGEKEVKEAWLNMRMILEGF